MTAPWLDRRVPWTARLLHWQNHERQMAITAETSEIVGVIWRWDHAEPLTRTEAEHWDLNLLPLGWSIVRDDRRAA